MTNYNERLDELLRQNIQLEYIGRFPEAAHNREDIVHINGNVYRFDFTEAKQAITSLIKELVAEAKPKRAVIHYDELGIDRARKSAANSALDRFEQNLLKALEAV